MKSGAQSIYISSSAVASAMTRCHYHTYVAICLVLTVIRLGCRELVTIHVMIDMENFMLCVRLL